MRKLIFIISFILLYFKPAFGQGFEISPVSLNFGNVAIGSNGTLQATVSNTGTSDLIISNITSSDGQFTFSPNTFPITILPGGNQLVDVTFTPTSTGLKTADITFTHNAVGSPTIYSVQGTGVAPGFAITPPNLNFGNVAIGSNGTLQATVNNTGTSDLIISNITSSDGQFTFSPNTFPITILPGGNQIVDVTFTPTSTGLKTADITFTHNAVGSPTIYSVQGTGVAPGFAITPPNLNFGNVAIGSNGTLQATVNNTGTSDLIISNITSSDGQFTFLPNTFPITILPGGNQLVDVTFTPTSTGLKTADITFTHNAVGSPTIYSVQGTGVAPGFAITPPNLNFGNVAIGSNGTLQATVNNTGTSDLIISNITSSDGQFTFLPNTFPITILPGGNQLVDVTFTPTSTGLKTADITFTHNAVGSPTIYSVQGTGVAPGFAITPPNLNFGNVAIGSNGTLQATVNNTGTSDLIISNITSSDGQFTFLPNTFPITILPGGNQLVDVTFTPTSTGLKTADITFTHNAVGSPTIYSVQGTGVAPGFAITPPNLNFGNVAIGSNGTLQATVNNTGTSDLIISNITSSDGQFTFSPNTFPITILPGGNQIVDVTFTPTSTGLKTADITFTHNAVGSPTIYSVQGTGVAPGFAITPPNLNFGNVAIGSNGTLQATVNNTGTSDLIISNITSSDGQFTFSPNTFPITILPGGNQLVDVTFTPTSTGLKTADITFTHNAVGSPTIYSVQGTGVAPGFAITPPNLNFGNVAIGSNGTLQATVNNTGTSDLIISNITSSDLQFTFSPNTFPITIIAGGNQIVDITFTPTSTGLKTADITFTHNAVGSPTIYSVQGTGVEAIQSSINTVNLINVITGTTTNIPITVTNNSTAQLLIQANITTGALNWNITPDTASIPAGGHFIFTLTFTAPAIPNTYTGTLIFSAAAVPSKTIQLSANVVTNAGLIFEQDTVYRLEDNSYMNVMQLKNLTDSLHALQFRLQVNKEISDNVILTVQNIQKGANVSDSSWILVYNIVRGPITPNGASVDEVFILLYNINQGAGLAPGDYNELFRVNYKVADLPALQDSIKSTFKITNAEASTFEGLPINITPSRDKLTIIARNRVSWMGDVNSDGCIDILDLIMVVDHIVSVDSLDATEFLRADIAPWVPGNPSPQPDGIVNVQELSLIQNIILTGIFPNGTPVGPCNYVMLPKFNGDEDAKVTFFITNEGISANLDSKVGIRGAQIEFANIGNEPSGMVINTDLGQGFYYYQSTTEILRTLLYDPLGEKYIEAGEHFLADMPFVLGKPDEVTLEKLILVDVNRQKLTRIQVEMIYGNPPSLPIDYVLFQNYPNPFNPGTTIEFALPEDVSSVKLSIYNALGEKVAELVNSALTAGRYQYQWNAKNLATGMYIYELRTEKFVSVKKMVLMK